MRSNALVVTWSFVFVSSQLDQIPSLHSRESLTPSVSLSHQDSPDLVSIQSQSDLAILHILVFFVGAGQSVRRQQRVEDQIELRVRQDVVGIADRSQKVVVIGPYLEVDVSIAGSQ